MKTNSSHIDATDTHVRNWRARTTFATISILLAIAASAQAAQPKTASLSDFTFDPGKVAAFFDRDGGMTSVKKAKFENEMFEKGLPQPWGARLLYHAIPDGTVFKVDTVYEKVDDNPDCIAIKLDLVGSEGYDWEYCNTAGNLPTTGSYYTHRGSDWPQAPWKKQDRNWEESFRKTCFPGQAYPRNMMLWVFRSGVAEEKISKLNSGSFLLSKGWFVGLNVQDGANERPALRGYYMLFPSEGDALALAHRGPEGTSPNLDIVPPRDKRDVLLNRMVKTKGNLVGLTVLLKAAKKHLANVQPGEALGDIVSECVGSSWFNSLVSAARGNDKAKFAAELDAAIRKLSDIEDRCRSAAVLEPGFNEHELDLAASLQFEKDQNKFRKFWTFEEKLWKNSLGSELYKDYIHCAYQAFPDEVSFAVRDVKSGRLFWTVELEAIEFGEIPIVLRDSTKIKWEGDTRQDRFFWYYMRERFGGGNGIGNYVLRLPKSRRDVEDWEPGQIVKSDRWIRETLLENSVVTKRQNGREWKENEREVYLSASHKVGPTVLYTSLQDRLEIEKAALK